MNERNERQDVLRDIDNDLVWLESQYRHMDLPNWNNAMVYDSGGSGDVIIFTPVLYPFDVIHVRNIRYFSKKYRIVIYQRRESNERKIYPKERAEEIELIMEKLGIEKAHFCGLNEGAIAAFALAKKNPQKVRSIVCTSIGMDNVVPRFEQWLGSHFPFNPSATFVGKVISWLMLGKAPDNFVVAYLWSKNPNPMVTMRNGVLPLYESYDLPMKQLTMPVLNIQSSPVVSEESARRFVNALPKGEFELIPGFSHLCMWTKANDFNELMEKFYSRILVVRQG